SSRCASCAAASARPRPTRRSRRSERGAPRAASARHPVAAEEVAGLRVVQEPDELGVDRALVDASDQAGALAAGDLGRAGDEGLVDEARREQLAVQVRAALAEQRGDAALPAQVLERRAQVDAVALVAHDAYAA